MADPAACAASGRDPASIAPPWPVEQQPVEGHKQGARMRLEFWAWRLAMSCLARLPRFAVEGCGALIARFAKYVDRSHAEAARGFLRQALVEHAGLALDDAALEARVHQAYRHLFRVAVDGERFDRRYGPSSREALLERCEVELSEPVRGVLDGLRQRIPGSPDEAPTYQGCVLVSGHCGDWEMAARISSAVGFRPLYIVSKPPANKPLSIDFQRRREETGVRLLPRRGAMQFAGDVVRGGGTLGMLLDQRARKRPVFAPLFGRRARCDRSAGVLLKRLACPVVFVAAYKAAGDLRWRFVGSSVLTPAAVRGSSAEEIAALVNRELETMALAEPDQYFWLHDRYRGGDDRE